MLELWHTHQYLNYSVFVGNSFSKEQHCFSSLDTFLLLFLPGFVGAHLRTRKEMIGQKERSDMRSAEVPG